MDYQHLGSQKPGTSSVPPVFIVGRFRSGTTGLWNVLRQNPRAFGIYEPLHGGLISHLDSEIPPDETHIGLTDYFVELRPYRDQIAKRFNPDFSYSGLALGGMDEHPSLKAYLDYLIDLAGSRTALVKFVRIDYRLPWLRKQFPEARIIYVFRNPRETWISSGGQQMAEYLSDPRASHYNESIFAAELLAILPELGELKFNSSYERNYYLWRIGKAVGEKYCDLLIDFDAITSSEVAPLFDRISTLTGLDTAPERLNQYWRKKQVSKWPAFANRVEFDAIERHCEGVLQQYGLLAAIERGKLDQRWPVVASVPARFAAVAIDAVGHRYTDLEGQLLRQVGEVIRLSKPGDAKLTEVYQRLTETQQRLLDAESHNHALVREVYRLQAIAAEAHALRDRFVALEGELGALDVRVGRKIAKPILWLLPPGSRRRKMASLPVRAIRTLRREGMGATIRKTIRFMRHQLPI